MESAHIANPVSLDELRRAIGSSCFRPSTARSLGYLIRDLALLAFLYVAAARVGTSWLLLPLWFAEGTIAWALFLVGHECGHGAFSRHRWLDTLVGHLTHTPLLIPYHSWRLSHRLHHRHAGDIAHDETWVPLTAAEVRALPWYVRLLRFRLFVFALPFYLLRRTPARRGSHWNPWGPLFRPSERARVGTSVALCAAMIALLVAMTVTRGPGFLVRHYLGPYTVFAAWLGLVTYLHHTDPVLPWYRGAGWTFVRGALSTMDRHYGLFERIHHDVGSHVVHHLFPRIPHYRLREATGAILPILGVSYRMAHKPIWRAFWDSARGCGVVPETGESVYYEPLPSGRGSRPATR